MFSYEYLKLLKEKRIKNKILLINLRYQPFLKKTGESVIIYNLSYYIHYNERKTILFTIIFRMTKKKINVMYTLFPSFSNNFNNNNRNKVFNEIFNSKYLATQSFGNYYLKKRIKEGNGVLKFQLYIFKQQLRFSL